MKKVLRTVAVLAAVAMMVMMFVVPVSAEGVTSGMIAEVCLEHDVIRFRSTLPLTEEFSFLISVDSSPGGVFMWNSVLATAWGGGAIPTRSAEGAVWEDGELIIAGAFNPDATAGLPANGVIGFLTIYPAISVWTDISITNGDPASPALSAVIRCPLPCCDTGETTPTTPNGTPTPTTPAAPCCDDYPDCDCAATPTTPVVTCGCYPDCDCAPVVTSPGIPGGSNVTTPVSGGATTPVSGGATTTAASTPGPGVNPPTGIALAIIPTLIAAGAAIVVKKRK